LLAVTLTILSLLVSQFCGVSTAVPGQAASAVAAIQRARRADEAMAAYAAASQADRKAPQVCEAYIQKMVSLGMPRAAAQAAATLAAIKTDNGLAWAVMGYDACQANQFTIALGPSANAALLLKDDTCALANLGQLLAWYDAQKPPPTLNPSVLAAVKQARADLANKEAFSTAYNRVKDALATITQAQQDAKKSLPAAQVRVDQAKQALNLADAKLQNWVDETDRINRRLTLLLDAVSKGDAHTRELTNSRIREYQLQIEDRRPRLEKYTEDRAKAQADLQKAQEDLAKLSAATSRPADLFRWELTGMGKPLDTSAAASAATSASPSAPADRAWGTIMNS
jgi:hypothetical protein